MKKSLTTALVLPTAIALALGGTALTASAASAEPAPVEQVVDPGAPTGTEDASGPDGLGLRDAEAGSADKPEAGSADEPEAGSADEPEVGPADEPGAGAGAGSAAGAGAEDLATAAAAAAPAAPVVLSPVAEGTVEATTDDGAVGSVLPVLVSGTGAPSAVVTVAFTRAEDDGVAQAPVSVPTAADGTWSTTVRLESGDWVLSTSQRLLDAAGAPVGDESAAVSTPFRAFAVTLAAPVVTSPLEGDRYAAVGGTAAVPLTGTGVPGARVRLALVAEDGTVLDYDGSRAVTASGAWATGTIAVPAGSWAVGALQEEVDGTTGRVLRVSPPSELSGRFVVVERAAVAAPVITSPAPGAVFSGQLEGVEDGFVGTTFSGTAEPGTTLWPFTGTRDELDAFRAAVARGVEPPLEEPAQVGSDGRWTLYGGEREGDRVFAVVAYDASFTVPVVSPVATVEYSVRLAGAASSTVPTTAGSTVTGVTGASLAYTGDDRAGDLALAAVGLVALGAASLTTARRRRRA